MMWGLLGGMTAFHIQQQRATMEQQMRMESMKHMILPPLGTFKTKRCSYCNRLPKAGTDNCEGCGAPR